MTLKSNKNEPAVTLERVNSARTALSDLYLEQLLQNKPKSEKVRGFHCASIAIVTELEHDGSLICRICTECACFAILETFCCLKLGQYPVFMLSYEGRMGDALYIPRWSPLVQPGLKPT